MTDAVTRAQQIMEADRAKAPVASDSPEQKQKKEPHKEIGEMFDEPSEPKDTPEWLLDEGRFEVRVTDGDYWAIVTDPGSKYSSALLDGKLDDTPNGRDLLAMMVARSVKKIHAPSIRATLGVEEGEALPHPAKLLEDHRQTWKKWREGVRRTKHNNLQARLRLSDENREKFEEAMEESEPETDLVRMIIEEWPSRFYDRVLIAICYVVTGHDRRWGILRKRLLSNEIEEGESAEGN